MSTTSRTRKAVAAAIVPVSIVGASALIFGGSYAAFNATTQADTSFTAGSVNLTNGRVSTPFSVSNIVPGATVTYACTLVTYTGTVDSTARFYLTGYTATNTTNNTGDNLEDRLALTVDQVAGDQTSTCATSSSFTNIYASGTPKALNTARYSWDTGIAAPATLHTGDTVTYRLGYNLPDLGAAGGNNGQMTDAVNFKLTWEARNV
ncbi:MAG: TasA family protein [Janthinobacterium lividum]